MKKKSLTLLLATTVASSILFSSCIGSFGLTNKLLTWNRSIDSKFVNELVFIAFWIVPVYEISALDMVSINFCFYGINAVFTIDCFNVTYIRYRITSAPKFDRVDHKDISQSGNLVNRDNPESTKLLKFNGDDEVVMYLPDGKEMNVELNQAGVLAFQQVADGYSYYAAK